MDALQNSSCESESDPIQGLTLNKCKPMKFTNDDHFVGILDNLQSLRKYEILCDIRFETDDGVIVSGHKNVLMTASPYFRAMFSNFEESNKNLVRIRKFDSSILKLLIDFIYTGKIKVSEENVQVLLPAANLLQLDFVNTRCAEFLKKQMDGTNCIGIKEFAELHNCEELVKSSQTFIKKHYPQVVRGKEFLSLSYEDLLKIILCPAIISIETSKLESFIKWVSHDVEQRKQCLPEIIQNVNLPLLTSQPEILNNLFKEPLLKNIPNWDNYVLEASSLNPHESVKHSTIPRTIPVQSSDTRKIILIIKRCKKSPRFGTEWFDPETRLRKYGPILNKCRLTAGLGLMNHQFLFVMRGVNQSSSKSVSMVDVYLNKPSGTPIVDMLGVYVLNNCLYAVGGYDGNRVLNSVEVFDASIYTWFRLSSMSTARKSPGVGVTNNRLYAIGGYDGVSYLKSVECYDPNLDNWTLVAEMSAPRGGVGVGVLDGVIYVVGGYNGSEVLNTVETYRPSDGVWSTVTSMHLPRNKPGVLALTGNLYVFGGQTEYINDDIVQIYKPYTNTWTLGLLSSKRAGQFFNDLAVIKPLDFITD